MSDTQLHGLELRSTVTSEGQLILNLEPVAIGGCYWDLQIWRPWEPAVRQTGLF
jgi:hypothetical protein